jgi:hypothetical protein
LGGDEDVVEEADPVEVLEGLLGGEELAVLRGKAASRLLRKKLGQP